jgi:triphosphatase
MNHLTNPVPTEIEAKLLVPHASDFDAIARVVQFGSYQLRARDTLRLHSLYVDTAAFTLVRQAVAVRLRRAGPRWEATAKWAGEVEDSVHERPELTVALAHAPRFPFALPEGPLRLHLGALVAGRPLAPILITDIERRRFDVLAAGRTQAVAELALDRVTLRPPRGRGVAVRYRELEIELREGTRDDVDTLAQQLQHRFDLPPSGASKFARGLALFYGPELWDTHPPTLRAHDTLGEAARKVIALHLGQLRAHDPGTRLGEDPEALHDMRVATRRLRAALRTFELGIPGQLRAYLSRELPWLGELLGSVRDLDVQLSLLDQYRQTVPAEHREGLAPFRKSLEAVRAQRRTLMLAALDSARYFRLLVQLERFALGRAARRRPFNEPITQLGCRAIRRGFRRVLKRGTRVSAVPTDEELHALRIRVKRLRYLLEFLRDITGKPGRQLVKRMIRLQDLLGLHHDATVTAGFIRRYVEEAGAQSPPTFLLALGAFGGEQMRLAASARADFQKAWRRFSRVRTAKDVQLVLDRLQDHARDAMGTPSHDGENV